MKPAFLAAAALTLAACSVRTQTTSGADYLARYDADRAAARTIGKFGTGKSIRPRAIDPSIRKAASVEPLLRFPARIGLARIEGGRLTAVPAAEADLWRDLAGRNPSLGVIAVVDPLVAHLTAAAVRPRGPASCRGTACIGRIVDTIRLGAARQHLDAVLIYEVGARSQKDNTFLAIADLTVLGGALLPTRSIEATGVARALLLDVRNGYPYGSATSSVRLNTLSTSFGSDARQRALRRKALLRVTHSLLPEIETMFRELVAKMRRRTAKR